LTEMTRWQAIGAIIVFLAGFAAGAVATVAAVWLAYWATGQSYEELQTQGDRYLAQIESYREKRGTYPTYLADAGVHPQRTRYGSWHYRFDGDRQHFRLSVGEYDSWDPFVLWWDSESRTWYLDR